MKRIHYISGLVLSLFVGAHVCNHLLALWGPELHIHAMEYLRMVYRLPVLEGLLLWAASVQIYSGIRLVLKKGFRQATLFGKLHVYSGVVLGFFLLMHTIATVGGRFAFSVDTNFYYAAMVVNLLPFAWFYLPYYLLGVLSFFVHVACIHRIKMGGFQGTPTLNWDMWVMIGMGFCVGILILMGLTDFGRGIDIPEAYRAILGQ